MSIRPLRPGHVLVVPREIIDHWIDLPQEPLGELMNVAHTIARAHKVVYQSKKIGLLIAGLEVSHVHIHLCPINHLQDMDYESVGPNPGARILEHEATRIRQALKTIEASSNT